MVVVDRKVGSGQASPFESLAALKSAGDDLLSAYAENRFSQRMGERALDFVMRARATGAVLALDDDRWAAQVLIDYWANVLFRLGHQVEDTALAPLDPLRTPELPESSCPYRGLKAFVEADRSVFFGRESQLGQALELLAENRWLALIGDSGTGKSSFLRAMLLPAVKERRNGAGEVTCIGPIFPGADPLGALAAAVADPEVSKRAVLSDPTLLRRVVSRQPIPVVLAVDQFEEVFTLCTDPTEQKAFIDTVADLATAGDGLRHAVVITMRSDFQDYVLRVDSLAKLVDTSKLRLGSLTAAELRDAIERPAALVGLQFESGIVDELVNDAVGEPAALPLLQFVLLGLWKKRRRNVVTREAYREVGRWREALTRAATELYERHLAPEEQAIARCLLLRLVRPQREGLEFFSRRTTRSALGEGLPAERVDRVLARLLASGIVRESEAQERDDTQFEIAHESLIRNWKTLAEWLDQERSTMRTRALLADAARAWDTRGRDSSALLRGQMLEEVQGARQELTQAGGRLSDLEVTYLHKSESHARRGRRIRRAILAGALGVMGASLVQMGVFLNLLNDRNKELSKEKGDAVWNYREAVARLLALKANTVPQSDLAMLLALESDWISRESQPGLEVLSALQRTPYLLRFVDTRTRKPAFVSFAGPQALAVLSLDGALVQYDLASQGTRPTERPVTDVAGYSAADFAQLNGALATASSDGGRVRVWTAEGRELPPTDAARVIDVALSPDGAMMVALTPSEIIRRDLGSGRTIRNRGLVRGDSEGYGEIAVNNRGLVAANTGREISFWSRSGRTFSLSLDPGLGRPTTPRVRFSADGQLVAAINMSGELSVWDVSTAPPRSVPIEDAGRLRLEPRLRRGPGAPGSLEDPESARVTTACAFSPDSRVLLAGQQDGSVNLYRRGSRRSDGRPGTSLIGPFRQLRGHAVGVFSLAMSPDRQTVASVDADGRLITWNIRRPFPLSEVLTTNDRLLAAAGSGDQRSVAAIVAAPPDDPSEAERLRLTLRTWRADRSGSLGTSKDWSWEETHVGQLRRPYPGWRFALENFPLFAMSSDASVFAWDAGDDTVHIRRIADGQALRRIDPPDELQTGGPLSALALSPDGRRLAASGADTSPVMIVDLATGKILHVRTAEALATQGPVSSIEERRLGMSRALAFSSDGRKVAWSINDRVAIADTGTGRSGEWLPTRREAAGESAEARSDVSQPVRALAFSADGTKLVAIAGDIIVWDTSLSTIIADLPFDGSTARTLAVNRTGDVLAVGGVDGAIRLWRRLYRPERSEWAYEPAGRLVSAGVWSNEAVALAFTPSHDHLIAVLDNTLQSLDLRPDMWRRLACGAAGRDLTPREWSEHLKDELKRRTCPNVEYSR
jgi:WD40 repeat protein